MTQQFIWPYAGYIERKCIYQLHAAQWPLLPELVFFFNCAVAVCVLCLFPFPVCDCDFFLFFFQPNYVYSLHIESLMVGIVASQFLNQINKSWNMAIIISSYLGLDATKPVFRISKKSKRLKPVSSATETS